MSVNILPKVKQWRRRILSHKYDFLRQPVYRNRRSLKSTCWTRFENSPFSGIGTFTITFMVLVFIVVLYLNGTTMSDIKYEIGLGPSIIMSVSTLDRLEDINFPEDDESMGHLKSEDEVIWKVDGFNQYISHFEDNSNSDVLGMFGKLPSGKKVDLKKGTGYWIFRNVPSSQDDLSNKTSAMTPSIRGFGIAEHVLDKYPQQDVEMAIAIKSYVDGEATLVVKYEDITGKHVHTDHIEQGRLKNKGFCFIILELPFEKRINTIHIRPTSTNRRRQGIVIIDQVLVVVGNRDQTESIIHTLVPKKWC